jgi:protein-S-isoprenylcysteine O-methyltransferase Ste14
MLATSNAPASTVRPQVLLEIYHDARRREDQWRIPQHLLALVTPILVFMAVLLAHGDADLAIRAGAVGIVTATGAALLAIQVARWHNTASWIANKLRNEYPLDPAVLSAPL